MSWRSPTLQALKDLSIRVTRKHDKPLIKARKASGKVGKIKEVLSEMPTDMGKEFGELCTILLKKDCTPDTVVPYAFEAGMAVVPLKSFDVYQVDEMAFCRTDDRCAMVFQKPFIGHLYTGGPLPTPGAKLRLATNDEIEKFFQSIDKSEACMGVSHYFSRFFEGLP